MSRRKKRRPEKPRGRQNPDAGRGIPGAPKNPRDQGPGKPARRGLALWLVPAAVIIAAAAVIFLLTRPGRAGLVKRDSGLNVVLITMDTTRADHLGCYGYSRGKTPNLDALARDGVRFENVYTQVPLTLPSHCSIMTGTYPIYHNVHNNGTYVLPPDQTTIAKVMKNNGFQTAAVVASFSVDSRFGLNQGFDLYDDDLQPGLPFKPANSERKAVEVAGLFSAWLDGRPPGKFFAWIHFFDPHFPYDPPPPYDREFADNPYDGEIASMDAAIGAVVGKLRGKNLLERTLIVLAGDHGEGFGDKVETGHGVFLYDETLKVPLILSSPGHLPAGKVIASRVRLIDIAPTILDMVGVPVPRPFQGLSLVPSIRGKKAKDLDSYLETFYPRENYGWSELTGLVSGDWKFIRAPKPELYNLKADPAEKRNEIAASGNVAAEMNRKLEALVKESAGIPGASSRSLTAAEQERLRSLGYVSFSGSGAKSSYPDPKDELDVLRLSQRAATFELEGKFAEAADAYAKLVPLMPDAPESYVNLALSQARLKKFDEAIATLRQGAERIPGSEAVLSRLGYTYLVTGRFQEALATMNRVLDRNPRQVDALTAAASALDSLGRKDEARAYLEKAVAVEPGSKFLRLSLALNLASAGKIGEAIEIYKNLIRDYPRDQALRQHLGIAYGVLGDYPNAIASFEQAIGIAPTPTAYMNLAVACKRAGRPEDAIRALRLYLENSKGENPAILRTAEAELRALENSLKK
jgi:arylsulfatase A-like enzyme/Flp pilus assembly protein TadD